MRAVQVTEFGGPEVLKPVELPDPEPGPGQQLIEVSRIGVNYADTDQKALIYVRLSSYAGESDTTTSPARQEEECRQWCAVNGYEVVEVIKDLDVSGSDKGLRLDRPGLLQVRHRWDEVEVLVFAKIDRIARNVLDWGRLAEEAKDHGVSLVSVADRLDLSDPKQAFFANVLQSFAQMEAAMISTRLTEAVAYMVREGRHRGGLAAFGWKAALRLDGPGYRLVLDPETSPVVREAIDRTIAGEPTLKIVEDFNAKGVASLEGKGWGSDTIRKLLRRRSSGGCRSTGARSCAASTGCRSGLTRRS